MAAPAVRGVESLRDTIAFSNRKKNSEIDNTKEQIVFSHDLLFHFALEPVQKKQRIFFRQAALKILEIRKEISVVFSLPEPKCSASYSAIFCESALIPACLISLG